MGRLPQMKVRLRDLPTTKQVTLANEFVRESIAGLPLRAALERPDDDPDAGAAEAELELVAERNHVFARGSLRGWMEVACSRCVGPVRIPVDETLQVTFMRTEDAPDLDQDTEVEVNEDDLDVYTYEDDVIDLEPLLREQLILALPYAPLCKEDCKGLCSRCGADLNETTCSCDRDTTDPRLAPLKNIKLAGSQGSR